MRRRLDDDAAFAFYRAAPGEPARPSAIDVVTLMGHEVARIDHFMSPSVLRAFALPELAP